MKRRLLCLALVASSVALANLGATSAARAQDEDEPIKDGKWHYTRQCAGCHNDNGDGKGPTITQLGLEARDFKQGGFAFGDSREQLKRTITSGIPGRSPMPSFKGILEDEDMELVIDYVRTLMPPRDDAPPKNTEMIVKDRALIARGKLPPITEGAKEVPRGLLIGTPEGMTFEYDISDVRLLGVRLGRFADREDWGNRGGGYLRPLGQLVWDVRELEMHVVLEPYPNPGAKPFGQLNPVLLSTWSRGSIGLKYELRAKETNKPIVTIDETLNAVMSSVGPAYRRTWHFRTSPDVVPDLSFGFTPRMVAAATSSGVWCLVERGEASTDAVWLERSEHSPIATEYHFEATVFRVPTWTPELAAQLEKELGL